MGLFYLNKTQLVLSKKKCLKIPPLHPMALHNWFIVYTVIHQYTMVPLPTTCWTAIEVVFQHQIGLNLTNWYECEQVLA